MLPQKYKNHFLYRAPITKHKEPKQKAVAVKEEHATMKFMTFHPKIKDVIEADTFLGTNKMIKLINKHMRKSFLSFFIQCHTIIYLTISK